MYESPISVKQTIAQITKDLVQKEEEFIYGIVIRQSVSVDKGELVRALKYDRDQYNKGYRDGEWDLFQLITSVWHGKQYYFEQENGIVYSRETGEYLKSRNEAIMEFLDQIGDSGEV